MPQSPFDPPSLPAAPAPVPFEPTTAPVSTTPAPVRNVITSLTGGGSQALDGQLVTTWALGETTIVLEGGAALWQLQTGTQATDTVAGYVRPADFHATLNPRVFVRLLWQGKIDAEAAAAAAQAYRDTAAGHAAAAAASALQSANVVAAQFKGGAAGTAVPTTLPVAGDYVLVATSGTTAGVSWMMGTTPGTAWAAGDRAHYTGTPGAYIRVPGQLVDESRVLAGDMLRGKSDALFFGRGQSGSHAVWSNTEHGIIGTNDFTVCIPFVDPPWYATSGAPAGITLFSNDPTSGYAGSAHNNWSGMFTSSGGFKVTVCDASPNHNANQRVYEFSKAASYDLFGGKSGCLIYGRRSGALFVRVNTTGLILPIETTVGSPVSTWAGYIDSTYFRLGQVYGGANYLGKLGAPLVYTFGLTDAECDQLVTQGPRSLPYRHGSWKNYVPTSGTSGWSTAGSGFTLSQYDLATDPDGIGLPPGASTSDYCLKVVRSGGSGGGSVYASGIFARSGPVWKSTANVRVTSLPAGSVAFGVSSGVDGASVEPNGQINASVLNTTVAVADGWKACAPTAYNYAASGGAGPAVTCTAAATDFVVYIHKPQTRPLGLLFDGVVQPCRVIDDAGPNGVVGRLVNRVDPITDRRDWRILATVDMTNTGNKQLLGGEVFINADRQAIDSIEFTAAGSPTVNGIGDGTTATRYAGSVALTPGRTRAAVANPFPADAAKTSLYANVTTAHASSAAEKVIVRGHVTH